MKCSRAILVSVILNVCCNLGFAQDVTSYEDLYIVEEREVKSQRPLNLEFSAGVITNHPNLDIQGINIAIKRNFGLNWRIGVNLTVNKFNINDTTKAINNELKLNDAYFLYDYHKQSLGLSVDFIPIIGHLNFLERRNLATTTGLSLKVNRTFNYFKKDYYIVTPAFIHDIEMTQRIFAGISLGQQFLLKELSETHTHISIYSRMEF